MHLIEIEPRNADERFHSLLFEQAGSARLESVISRLLAATAVVRGVRRNGLRSLALSGVTVGLHRVSVWRHTTLGKATGAGLSLGSLDGARVLAAMSSLSPIGEHQLPDLTVEDRPRT